MGIRLEEDAPQPDLIDIEDIDPETVAQLKEDGFEIPVVEDGVPSDDTKVQVTDETDEAAPTETEGENPPPEVEVEQPVIEEPAPLILGKYKSDEDVRNALQELETAYTQSRQEVAQTQRLMGVVQQLQMRPDGQKILAEIASGQPYQAEPVVDIPQNPQEFSEWLGGDLQGNLSKVIQHQNRRVVEPLVQEIRQLQGQNMAIMSYLEGQTVEKKYGTPDDAMRPYLEAVEKEFGPQAQAMPQALKLRIAMGDRTFAEKNERRQTATAKVAADTAAQEKITREHREKAISATVESADRTSSVGAKVIDTDKMNADQLEKFLKEEMGAREVERE